MHRLRSPRLAALSLVLSLSGWSSPVGAGEEEEGQIRGASAVTPSAPIAPVLAAPAENEHSAPPAGSQTADPADDAEAALRRLLDQLVDLEVRLGAEVAAQLSRADLAAVRGTAQDALVHTGRLRQERDARRWFEERGPSPVPPPPVLVAPPPPPSFDAAGLASLESAVQSAPFNEGKLAALREGLGAKSLTVSQATRLLDLFGFSRDRVEVLVLVHPRLLDPERFDALLGALKFESDRQAVRDRLRLTR